MGCCCGHKKVVKNDFNKLEPKKPQPPIEIDNTEELRRQEEERKRKELEEQRLKQLEAEQKEKERLKKLQDEEEERRRKEEEERKRKEAEEVRAINLLETKPVEVKALPQKTQQDLDEDEFTSKIAQLQKTMSEYMSMSKDSFSIAYTDSFTQNKDNTVLSNKAGRQDTTGPLIKDKRISNINQQDKYNFAQVLEQREFKQYKGKIYIERLLEKPKHSVCSYLGKIDEKYCCVKLIPCIKKESADKWIKAIQDYQKIKNPMFEKNFQLYSYYQIELIDNKPFANLYIISNLEQYNAYTFAIDEKTTIEQRAKVAYDCIQILSNVLMSKYDEKQGMGNNNANLQQASIQQAKKIYKNIFTVKNNNILISILENGECKVQLSDWQLLVDEFQEIIPKEEIQDVDHEMQSNLLESSNLLSNQLRSESEQKTVNLAKNQVQQFVKRTLNLLIFSVNYQLGEELRVKYFISGQTFIKIKPHLDEVNENERIMYKKVVEKIKANQDKLNKEEQDYCVARSKMIAEKLGQNFPTENHKLFVLYFITSMQDCEAMRPYFPKYVFSDNQQRQANEQQVK